MKRTMIVLLALFAATLFTSTAFAADRVEVKVTSEPIAQYSTSDKAGGYTLAFDSDTVILPGDQITIDLPINVTLANDVDLMIPFYGTGVAGVGNDTAAAFASGAVVLTGAGLVAGADGLEFYITGTAGTQRVTINVLALGAATDITVGNAAGTDVFTLKFFDQNIGGVFIDGADVDTLYDDAAAVADNTRCINVSAVPALTTTIQDSLDSATDKYTFIPSNPQVAHVVLPNTVGLVVPKDTDLITIGTKTPVQGGANETCNAFDFEAATEFCVGATAPNYAILAGVADFDATNYSVTMEILTTGVYFTDDAVGVNSYATSALAEIDGKAGVVPAALVGVHTYDVAPAVPNVNECDVDPADYTKSVTVPFVIGASTKALLFDIPSFNYDVDEVTSGADVLVKITLSKLPCGSVTTQTVTVGTLGCVVAGVSNNMSFPYFTAITGDSFWDGFAIVNQSATAGTATLMIYEADGDVFTASIPVAANSMAVQLTSDLLASATQVSGAGTLGDARFYMTVNANFNVDGFAMMADPATGESMGYLPRQ